MPTFTCIRTVVLYIIIKPSITHPPTSLQRGGQCVCRWWWTLETLGVVVGCAVGKVLAVSACKGCPWRACVTTEGWLELTTGTGLASASDPLITSYTKAGGGAV